MKILGRMAVFPEIPERIHRLHDLAYNLWWTWNPPAQRLYATHQPGALESSEHNAVRVLLEVDAAAAGGARRRCRFPGALRCRLCRRSTPTCIHEQTWFRRTYPEEASPPSPISPPSLGCTNRCPSIPAAWASSPATTAKRQATWGCPSSASAFSIRRATSASASTRRASRRPSTRSCTSRRCRRTAATGPDGHEVMISVDLPGRKVYAKVWRIQVGRIPLYLMDTDVEPNTPGDRVLSARLYGGDHEMRIAQEIMLGIGGVRAIRALGLDPMVWHMNEGHSAFLGLERCRELIAGAGCQLRGGARDRRGQRHLHHAYAGRRGQRRLQLRPDRHLLRRLLAAARLDRDAFHALARAGERLGRRLQHDGAGAAALRRSTMASARCMARSRARCGSSSGRRTDVDEVPITSITNGVHTATWLAPGSMRSSAARWARTGTTIWTSRRSGSMRARFPTASCGRPTPS